MAAAVAATASNPSPSPFHPLLRDKQALEEQEQRLHVAEQRLGVSREALDRLVKVLSAVRAGAEHLVDKLQHISLVMTHTNFVSVSALFSRLIPPRHSSPAILSCAERGAGHRGAS